MSHQQTVALIEQAAKNSGDKIIFDFGRASDLNKEPDMRYPIIWLDPLTSSLSFLNNLLSESYSVRMLIAKRDKVGADADESKLILDEMSDLTNRFLMELNFETNRVDDLINSDNIELTGLKKDWLIQAGSKDCLTGWYLEFTIIIPDVFEYCKNGINNA